MDVILVWAGDWTDRQMTVQPERVTLADNVNQEKKTNETVWPCKQLGIYQLGFDQQNFWRLD